MSDVSFKDAMHEYLRRPSLDGLQLLTQWEEAFNFPSGSKLGLLGAIQNIGSLASLPFTPYFADGLGRKRTIFFGAVVMVAAAIIQTASQSVNMFIGARFMRTLFPYESLQFSES